VCSKVHTIAKNALTMAYASERDGLMRANARLGRIGLAGAIAALPFGIVALKAVDPAAVLDRVNRLMCRLMPGETATMCLVAVDLVDGSVRLANADGRWRGSSSRRWARRGPAGFAVPARVALRDAEVPALWFAVVGGAGWRGILADATLRRCTIAGRRLAIASLSVGAIGARRLAAVRAQLLTVYALPRVRP
jgi:hypothetical protein